MCVQPVAPKVAEFSFVKESANLQTADETQAVLVYELSKVFACLSDYESDAGYDTFAKTEFADMVSMARMLCEQEKWNFNAMVNNAALTEWGYSITNVLMSRMFIALGKVVQSRHYYKRFGTPRHGDPQQMMQGFVVEMYAFCAHRSWVFQEMKYLGEERYKERMDDLKANGISRLLKSKYRRSV